LSNLLFQYCPKLAVLSEDRTSVLLCKRQGETEFDEFFSLIGGKMEHGDESILGALRREKTEEVGEDFKVEVLVDHSINVFYVKKSGVRMVLPHHYARHLSGEPVLNAEEYSEYRWVPLVELDAFEPKVPNIAGIVFRLRALEALGNPKTLEVI
jgi:8-oxo-dGTP pyrophosphatase MutT (NUDIX family)